MTYLVSNKKAPVRSHFVWFFLFHNIMFLTYIKFKRNLFLRKSQETVAYAFKRYKRS